MWNKIIINKDNLYSIHFFSNQEKDINWIDFKVYDICLTRYPNDNYKTEHIKYTHNSQTSLNHNDIQPAFTGFLKWDGCIEFKSNGFHFCGPMDFNIRFNNIIKEIYKECSNIFSYCNYKNEL